MIKKVFAVARLPSQQPLVDGGQGEHSEQQPDGQREEDERERLDEQMEADVKQRAGQLLRGEAARLLSRGENLPPSRLRRRLRLFSYLCFQRQATVEENKGDGDIGDGDLWL